ncbi:Forkhead associated (FHA) domain, binds pSer, pThr, pTyr [Lachnospiraceae bacterium XBB1006]|nr:Forkhead associated (FHA) domain, binds pSer, pThr, pTyr [Lachnospiraceae bacterium XBB1006]
MRNTNYNIKYKRKLNESYQVCTFSECDLVVHELEMLRRNQLPGFLPIEFMVAEGKGQFWHSITGLQSLTDMLRTGRFAVNELKTFMKTLAQVADCMENYLLREAALSMEEIYFSADGKRVYFAYLPIRFEEAPSLKAQVLEVLDGLIKESGNAESDYVSYLFRVYDILRRENACLTDVLAEWETESQIANSEPQVTERELFLEQTEELSWDEEPEKKPSFIGRLVKEHFLDLKWSVKKKARQYKDWKPEVWDEDEELVVKPTEELTDHRTQMLVEEPEGQGMRLHFADDRRPDVRLTKEQYVLGKREEYADLVVEDASVSRVHALIKREEEGYYLEDLNSLNGTFLNGTQLDLKERVLLKAQDVIAIGKSKLVFQMDY